MSNVSNVSLTLSPLVPPIVLLGPPGCGKSTVGPALAVRLGWRFVDLDVDADAAGWRPDDVLGEMRFRVREHQALKDILANGGAVVVAAGAGVVDVDENAALLAMCLPVVIDTPLAICAARLIDDTTRPWLKAVRAPERVSEIIATREEGRQRREARARIAGGNAGVVVDGDAPVDVVVGHIQAALARARIPFAAADDVSAVAPSVVGPLSPGRRSFVVADDAVVGHFDDVGLQREHVDLTLSLSPQEKTLHTVEVVLRALSAAALRRTDLIVAVGGGLLLDVVGLAAALHQRGTPWRAVPTTLLAMVDAGYGGKTAVDVHDDVDAGARIRNAAGAFWAPESAVVWTGFLRTLPENERRQGQAEMLKHALLWGAKSAAELRAAIGIDVVDVVDDVSVARSRGFKVAVVARDPREAHLRAMLNLGHTVAHALESCFPTLPHGDAVLHGLKSMLALSVGRAGLSASWADEVRGVISGLGPSPLPQWSSVDAHQAVALRRAIQRDKKGGRFVLLSAPGVAVLADGVDDDDIDAALQAAFV